MALGTPRVELFQDAASAWRWHLQSENGEYVAQGEGHTTKSDAKRAAKDTARIFGCTQEQVDAIVFTVRPVDG